MKNKIILLLGFITMLSSCSEDFTQIAPVGSLSDEFLESEQGVDLLLVSAYSALDGQRINASGNEFAQTGDNWWLDVLSDDAHKGSTDGDQADLFAVEVYDWSTANPYILGRWSSIFSGITRANAVIEKIASIEGADLNAKLAEARFLRGHFNFELQRMYGNVPYISEANNAITGFNEPNPGPIWDKIEDDFNFAVTNLPESQGAEIGRANAWAAKAYLGKVLLQQGKTDLALPIFTDVIENGPYGLNPEFVANFESSGENSNESVFTIQFTVDSGLSFNGNVGGKLNYPNPGPFGSCCGFYQPSQDLVNAFQTDAATGLPLLDTFNQTDVANDFGLADDAAFTPHTGPLDPRLDYTVGRRGIDYNRFGTFPGQSWIRAESGDISGPYLPAKNVYQNGDVSANQGTGPWGQQHSGINYHIIRFADVLLMGAEAAAEEGALAPALAWVNLVRNRAKNMSWVQNEDGTAPAANYVIEPYVSFDDPATAIKAVRHERRLELGMEGHRLFDLRRWGNAPEIISEYVINETRTIPTFASKVKTYEAKNDLLPIPQAAIDLSENILSQNAGF